MSGAPQRLHGLEHRPLVSRRRLDEIVCAKVTSASAASRKVPSSPAREASTRPPVGAAPRRPAPGVERGCVRRRLGPADSGATGSAAARTPLGTRRRPGRGDISSWRARMERRRKRGLGATLAGETRRAQRGTTYRRGSTRSAASAACPGPGRAAARGTARPGRRGRRRRGRRARGRRQTCACGRVSGEAQGSAGSHSARQVRGATGGRVADVGESGGRGVR